MKKLVKSNRDKKKSNFTDHPLNIENETYNKG